MKVSHVEDNVTHAVISGAQAIDFGISDSPEFFNILSSTLYTDQMLAVVRETLCNLWDAHIEFGCEDVYGDVTLNNEYLIIRDYGPGISPKMIGPVYGTYGGSTKTANGEVTGGFGLGCKAPFAYVDDFEVTSYHDGKMTVYRLSKSNAEVGGKPSIIPVVQNIPTQEHGLQVKIAVKSTSDRIRFTELIRRIVQNGAMKVKLNDQELPTLPFNDMEHGFMLTRAKLQENFTPITVRYGNVIYPIEKEASYASEYDNIITFLNRIANGTRYYGGNSTWTLVLQASPNTVSVTPSREALSNQKHTLATVGSLMRDFLAVKDKELHTECFRLLDQCIEQTWLNAYPAELFDASDNLPNLVKIDHYGRRQKTAWFGEIEERQSLIKFPEFVQQYASVAYPDFSGFSRSDRLRRIDALIRSGFGGVTGKKLLKTYRREYLAQARRPNRYKKNKERYGTGQLVESSWFHKQVVWPLIKGMTEDSPLRTDKLFVYPTTKISRTGRENLFPATRWKSHNIDSMWRFVRNIVILSFNKMDVLNGDADWFALSKFWLGKTEDALVYITPRNEAKVQAAREYFTKKGVFLIDLTVNQHQQYIRKQEEYAATPATIKRPKKQGIPVLGKMIDENGKYTNLVSEENNNDIERTKDPKFVYKDARRNRFDTMEEFSASETKLFLDMFGSAGGFCSNQNQMDRYIKAGALDWKDYVLDKLVEEYTNNPRIREYLPFDYHRVELRPYYGKYHGVVRDWMEIIETDRDLFEYFGLIDNRTENDKNLMQMYRLFHAKYLTGSKGQRNVLEKIIENIPLAPELNNLLQQISDSKFTNIFNPDYTQQLFVHHEMHNVTETQRNRIRDIILFAIEGK